MFDLDATLGDGDDSIQNHLALHSILDGGPGDDVIAGGPAVDQIDGGEGADDLSGGGGIDTVSYLSRTVPLTISLDDVVDVNGLGNDGAAGEHDNVHTDVEGVAGGQANDTLIGSPNADTLNGSNGDDTLDGGGGPDTLVGFAGSDTVTYASRTAPVSVDLLIPAANQGVAGEGDHLVTIENVIGGSKNDTLLGDNAANVLTGGRGKDTIDGRGGSDRLNGDAGADTMRSVDHLLDIVSCGAGTDTAFHDLVDVLSGCE